MRHVTALLLNGLRDYGLEPSLWPLVEPCVLAGSRPGSMVLDPFFGSGTVGEVCLETGRRCVGIELKPEYAEIARRRIGRVTLPLAL